MSHATPDPEWSDSVRDASAPDDLGRQSFVDSVVRRIERSKSHDASTVFGLVGSWGSGKSSIIARIRTGLSTDWAVTDFTPWSTGNSAAMSFEFVNTLGDLLGAKPDGDLRRRLAGYAGFATPLLSAIPLLGTGAKGVADEVLEAVGAQEPWQKQFESLSGKIGALGKRVLIVVDDVDRLGGEELLTLLRLVRLLGRFRGVHYLIAYDQDTIEDLLKSTGAVGRSSSFMEKIVQFPFEVPPVSDAAALRLVNKTLSDLLSAAAIELDDIGVQRATELAGMLAPQIQTPRALARFREQLLSFADHVKDAELDVLDYVAVTWLRLMAHGIWSKLTRWQEELRTGAETTFNLKPEIITDEQWRARIADADPAGDVGHTMLLLSFLFPNVITRGLTYNVQHDRALADATYFARYLLLAIPEDDVSDELIRSTLDALASGLTSPRVDEFADVLDSRNVDVANLAYARASAWRRSSNTTSLELLRFLAERQEARKEDAPAVGAPRNALVMWITREVGIALRDKLLSPQNVVDWFGEDQSLGILMQITSRMPEFRPMAREIAKPFSDYWDEQLHLRFGELLNQGPKLGLIANLAVFTRGADEASGLLDFAITDFDSYVAVAEAFVKFDAWTSDVVKYSLAFRQSDFVSAVSRETRRKYADRVEAERTDLQYETEDLPEPRVDPAIVRAFTLASLSQPEVAE